LATYRVLIGIDYAGKRAEPGTVVDDLPSKSVSWLVAQGVIEKADANVKPANAAPKPVEPVKPREPQSPSKGGK
jgi:hypothetical protein